MVGETKPEHHLPPRRPPFTRRQLMMQGVVAMVILASGIGIGTGGTILALKSRIITRVRLPGPPGPEPNEIVSRWRGEYGLNDKQAQQVKDTLTKQFAAIGELRQKFVQAEQTEREKFAAAMKKIFTPEQFTQWDEDIKKMIEHMQRARSFDGRRGGRGGPPRGERGPDRPRDPNERRWDGPPRGSRDFDGSRRGSGPPRGPMDRPPRPEALELGPPPDGRPQDDQPPGPPAEVNSRPADVNTPP
jgi:hypothetical protein